VQEVEAKVPEPTDGEVESYYMAQQPRLNQPIEDVKPRLRQQLKQAKVQLARQNYLAEVLRKYEGKVRLSYRDFPLRQIHPQAQKADEAARCAAEHGKLDVQSLTEHARSLKLSGPPFEQCLVSGRYTAAVGKDLEEGRQAGVSGTPAFFINGVVLSGAIHLDSFTRVTDEELVRAW